jgi:hypothetical protein
MAIDLGILLEGLSKLWENGTENIFKTCEKYRNTASASEIRICVSGPFRQVRGKTEKCGFLALSFSKYSAWFFWRWAKKKRCFYLSLRPVVDREHW